MRSALVLALMLVFGAQAAEAQWRRSSPPKRHRHAAAPVQFGVRGGYDFEERVGSAGAQVRIPLVRQLPLVPSGDVFFGDAATEWQLNADLLAAPDQLGGLYAGVGAALVRRDLDGDDDRDTEAGYNLVLGLNGRPVLESHVRPFVEARWTRVQRYSPFRLVLGIDVPVR